jgi:long-chain acyl-CoA synthetase
VLYEHPGVLDVAVIAVPDEALGEEIGAAIVRRPGGRSVASLMPAAVGLTLPSNRSDA